MNRNFQASTRRTRIAVALVAVLCTTLVAGGIEALIGHYAAPSHLVSQPSVQVAFAAPSDPQGR